MRGFATVIVVGFTSIILFGIFAPAVLEPIAQLVVSNDAVQSSPIAAQSIANGLLSVVLKWAVVIVLGSGVTSAAVYYLRRERVGVRR